MRATHLATCASLLAMACTALPCVAHAQTAASPYTYATRYDLLGRVTGTISPDPDGSGGLKFAAVRNKYDSAGNLVTIEQGELSAWRSQDILPDNWTGFAILKTTVFTYDGWGRKRTELVKGSDGVAKSLTQYSYDALGRLECTAVRMNSATFSSPPASACTLGPNGSYGSDRITKNVYDAAGQLVQVRKAVGTSIEQAYTTYSYTSDGKQEYVVDANGNRAKLEYDGFDRPSKWTFPSTAKPSSYNPSSPATALATAGSLNTADYEQYAYDVNDNRTSLRKRDATVITFQYDNLNRMTVKDLPARAGLASTFRRDVYYAYDAHGRQTDARFGSLAGDGIYTVYDGFGRVTSNTSTFDGLSWTLRYCYDRDGNRTRLGYAESGTSGGDCSATWSNYAAYAYDGLDRPAAVSMVASASWTKNYTYNQRGLLATDALTSGTASTSFGFDSVGRLSSSVRNVAGTTSDITATLAYAPSNQLSQETKSNEAYAYAGRTDHNLNYTANGLNQYTAIDNTGTTGIDASYCFDKNGNLTADGTYVYLYDIENRLVQKRDQGTANTNCSALAYTGTVRSNMYYDPLGRLYESTGSIAGTTYYLIDGDALVAEYTNTGTLRRRYVHGAAIGVDDPVAWYEGNTLNASALRYLYPDRQGSITLVSDSAANAIRIFRYDEYGVPESGDGATLSPANGARFMYTGQAFMPDMGMYYYKARMYSPVLGRFMQTDPVGYEDQINLYAYLNNDPLNRADPTGKFTCTSNGNGTYTCTATGIWDAIGMYAYKAAVEMGVVPPPPPGVEDVPENKPPFRGEPGSTVRGGTGSRTYGPDGYPETDRDAPHGGGPPCEQDDHCHDWGRPEGGGAPNGSRGGDRGPARPPIPGDPPPPRGANVPPPSGVDVPEIPPSPAMNNPPIPPPPLPSSDPFPKK